MTFDGLIEKITTLYGIADSGYTKENKEGVKKLIKEFFGEMYIDTFDMMSSLSKYEEILLTHEKRIKELERIFGQWQRQN